MPPVIVPIVAPLLVSLGVGGIAALEIAIAVGTGLAALTSPIGLTVLSVGLSIGANALARSSLSDKGKVGAGVNAADIRLNTRQEVPAQRWVYGEVLIGGPLFFEEAIGKKYYQGFLWSEGPISSVEAIYNTQERIVFNDIPFNTILTPSTNLVDGPPYQANVRLSVRRGLLSQPVDPLLAAAFPALPAATFRQRGVATLVFEADSGATFAQFEQMWGSARRPNPIARIRGVPVYDPRDGTQRLPIDPDDPEDLEDARLTWKWSNNASLVIADYLWRRNGGRIPLTSMHWDRIAKSATYDDSLIGTRDGRLIPRHTIDGVVTAGQNPTTIIQSMLTANRGFVCRQQGRVWVQSSMPLKPVLTVTDDMIIGALEYRRAAPKRTLLNRVRSRFIDPRQAWTTVDGPIIDRPDLRALDGDLYEATVDLMWTADHRRAQRLQKAFLADSRLGRTIQTTLAIDAAIGLEAGDVVRFDSRTLPRINGLYRIGELGLALEQGLSGLTLSCAEYDPSIEQDWDPTVDEQPYELPDLEAS
ncbi:MAG: phage tail protein [Hyphomicrobiaceae bacterium]